MKQDEKNNQLHISVRNLVEFIFREGDIDNRAGKLQTAEAMMEGTRLHKKIQKSQGGDYQAEVPLKIIIEEPLYELTIEGRADGVFTHVEDDSNNHTEIVFIDEIKGIYRSLELLQEPVFVHQAQAMCYAFIYSKQNELDKIRVQMTYINLETEEIKKFEEEFDAEYLKRWFYQVVDEYYKWAKYLYENKNLTMSTANILEFPYEYRKGQRDVVVNVLFFSFQASSA